MAKEEKEGKIVKSFRISEDIFERANDIFMKEGFSFSEVIRLLCDATLKEGRIPRGISTKDIEPKLDTAQKRESYIDSILQMAGIVPEKQRSMTNEEKLLKTLFHEDCKADELSNSQLREWAAKWGFPDDISVATLAELHDCGIFPNDPWYGIYDANIQPVNPANGRTDENLKDAMIIMSLEDNIKDNLEQIKRQFQTRAVKFLFESNNKRGTEKTTGVDTVDNNNENIDNDKEDEGDEE